MNAERLNALLHLLQEDFSRTKLPDRIEHLCEALQELVDNEEAAYRQAVGEALKDTREAVAQSKIDDLSPAWKQMINEIGYTNSVGGAIAKRLDESFTQFNITPSLVLDDINHIRTEILQLNSGITNGILAFKALSIGAEELEPGECELGFMVPKSAVASQLFSFANECKEFDFIFGNFSEIVTGQRDHYKIRTISSSDLSVFLDALPQVAVVIAEATQGILHAYKQLLEIRKLKGELLKQDIPKESLESIDKHANDKMENSINEIAINIMVEHGGKLEEGRAHELKNSLSISLGKLANRIDRGYHIEVRIGALPEHHSDGSETASELQTAEMIRRISNSFGYKESRSLALRKSWSPSQNLLRRPMPLKDLQKDVLS